MCTGVMNDVVGKIASTKTSTTCSCTKSLFDPSFESALRQLRRRRRRCLGAVRRAVSSPATKEGDRWLFDYGLSRTWTPDGPVVEYGVMDTDALNALKRHHRTAHKTRILDERIRVWPSENPSRLSCGASRWAGMVRVRSASAKSERLSVRVHVGTTITRNPTAKTTPTGNTRSSRHRTPGWR